MMTMTAGTQRDRAGNGGAGAPPPGSRGAGHELKSVITCDDEGRIETFNDDAEQIFGYAKAEVIGKKRVSLFSPGPIVLEHVPRWLAAAKREGAFETDTVFVRKNGTKFPAHIRITPTKRGYCGVTVPLPDDAQTIARVTPHISWTTRAFIPLIITRAPFLTATLVPVLVGAAIAAYTSPSDAPFAWGRFALALVGALALHVAANVWNDAFDWLSGADQHNNDYFLPFSGGSRAIELGLVTVRSLFVIGAMAALVAIACGALLATSIALDSESARTLLIIGAIGGACAFFYTAPPIRLSARRGLGELAVGLCFGPLLTAGTAVAIAGASLAPSAAWWTSSTWIAALAGVPLALLVTAILWVNEIPDAPSDARAGKNHAVVTLGPARARLFYVAIVTTALATLVVLVTLEIVPLFAIVALVTLPIAVKASRVVVKHYADRALIDGCRATIQLHALFGLLMAAGIVAATLLRS